MCVYMCVCVCVCVCMCVCVIIHTATCTVFLVNSKYEEKQPGDTTYLTCVSPGMYLPCVKDKQESEKEEKGEGNKSIKQE